MHVLLRSARHSSLTAAARGAPRSTAAGAL
jgi:hypothetical protein